jgi:hypothetical protein
MWKVKRMDTARLVVPTIAVCADRAAAYGSGSTSKSGRAGGESRIAGSIAPLPFPTSQPNRQNGVNVGRYGVATTMTARK